MTKEIQSLLCGLYKRGVIQINCMGLCIYGKPHSVFLTTTSIYSYKSTPVVILIVELTDFGLVPHALGGCSTDHALPKSDTQLGEATGKRLCEVTAVIIIICNNGHPSLGLKNTL